MTIYQYLIITLIIIWAYHKTIFCGLIIDDLHWRKQRVNKDGWKKIYLKIKILRVKLYGGGLFRNLKADHAFTIFLHCFTCYLINYNFGIFSALLYAVNPVNHQTSIWLNGRRYQVNIILMLAVISLGWYGLVLYPLTFIFQINAIFLPVYFSLWGLAVIPLAAFIFQKDIKSRWDKIPKNNVKEFNVKRLIVIIKTYGYYFFRMIIPGVGFVYNRFLYYWGMNEEGNKEAYGLDFAFLKGVAAIALSGLGIWHYGLPFVFMVLALLQWSNIVTCTMTIADRYMSLPNVFMMFFVSDLAFMFLGNYAPVVLSGLFIYYFIRLKDTILMYYNIETMYRHHINWQPEEVAARSFYVRDLLASNKPCHALAQVTEGLHYNPKDFRFLFQAGLCLEVLGNKKEALHYLERSRKNMYGGQEEKLTKLIDDTKKRITMPKDNGKKKRR